jgi:hypothetical protein
MSDPVNNQNINAAPTEVKEEAPVDPHLRNNRIAAVLYLIFQGGTIALFAIFVRPQAYLTVIDNGLFEAVGVALLVLVGKPPPMQDSVFTSPT